MENTLLVLAIKASIVVIALTILYLIFRKKSLPFEKIIEREIGRDNSGLPIGAVKYTNRVLNDYLLQVHRKIITLYNETRIPPSIEKDDLPEFVVGISDSDYPTFGKQLHPMVEGYEWFRGYSISLTRGKIFIFTGWMETQKKGGAPLPIIYTLGNVPTQIVTHVVKRFHNKIVKKMARNCTEQNEMRQFIYQPII